MSESEYEAPTAPHTDEQGQPEVDTPETEPGAVEEDSDSNADESADTFPRTVVEKLRGEAKSLRDRTKAAEEERDSWQRRLMTELVRSTGKLANPEEFAEFNAEYLEDPEKLNAALDELTSRKPYLKSRRPQGSISKALNRIPQVRSGGDSAATCIIEVGIEPGAVPTSEPGAHPFLSPGGDSPNPPLSIGLFSRVYPDHQRSDHSGGCPTASRSAARTNVKLAQLWRDDRRQLKPGTYPGH